MGLERFRFSATEIDDPSNDDDQKENSKDNNQSKY
jgi:hypothetical protein